MSEPAVEYGGCPWPVDFSTVSDADKTIWEGLAPEMQERAIALASSTLERLTAHRVSNCPITVRPCHPQVVEPLLGIGYWRAGYTPMNFGGPWSNVCMGAGMGCRPCEVPLPPPVTRVTEVKVDGVVVDPGKYAVHNARYLVWTPTDEDCPFPSTQDVAADDTEPNTFSVTYLNAYP